MKKYLVLILAILVIPAGMSFGFSTVEDFTGESYFRAPLTDISEQEPVVKKEKSEGTIPPIKLLRLKTKQYFATSDARKEARAKQKAIKKALKAYKKNQILEDAPLLDIPTDKDIEHLEMAGVERSKSPQRVIVTCDEMDYSTETAILNANGHVLVKFVQEDTDLKADHLIYDKRSNHMNAFGNVVITKKNIDVYGDSISVDLNEENALIDKPLSKLSMISVSAEKGYVHQNKLVQEKGSIHIDASYPLHLEPHGRAPKLNRMVLAEDEASTIDDIVGDSEYYVKVSNIIMNSDKKLESIELRRARIYKGKRHIFTIPWVRLYTNKNHDFVDGDFPEIGSRRYLGMFVGPGWAIKMPFGSILKIAPVATYKKKFGVGGFARFLSGTNETEFGYGTSKKKFVLRGQQQLDDHLKLEYAMYDYMDNWFLGRRMPKYGASLVYDRSYKIKNFFMKSMDMKFTHNASIGLFADPKKDKYYKKLHGDEHKTIRMRYMAEVEQKLFNYENKKNLANVYLSVVGQGSASLYGTGDTQFVGRIGPRLHTQYKRWMQDIGYFQSAYDDKTPLPVFDAYRYGRSHVYVREYLRVHKFLTLAWFGGLTFSDDRYNNSLFQECAFYVCIGPDDLKLNVGYDLVREHAYVNFSMALDPKGTTIDYDRMVVKNPENFKFDKKKTFYTGEPEPEKKSKDVSGKVLKQAIVEDITNVEEDDDEL